MKLRKSGGPDPLGAVAPLNTYSIQTDSVAYSTPYSVGTNVYFFGVNWPGREAEYTALFSFLKKGLIVYF